MLNGFFTVGGADDPASQSPDAIALRRQLAASLLRSGSDASPVASPWQGAARLAQALVGGYDMRQADLAQGAAQKAANDQFASLMGTGGTQVASAAPATTTAAPAAASDASSPDDSGPDQQPTKPTGKLPSFALMGGGAPGTAQSWNMNRDYLPRLAQIESGGNPNAVNKSSGAAGLFQFMPSTWKQYAGAGASPLDPQAATQAVAALTQDNANALTQGLGRPPTPGELYLAHQQGAGGALALLSHPGARAGDIVGDKAVALNGGDPNMSAQQFANLWINKFQGGGNGAPVMPAQVASLGAPQAAPTVTADNSGYWGSAFEGDDTATGTTTKTAAAPAATDAASADAPAPAATPVQYQPPGTLQVSPNSYAARVPAAMAILNNPYATAAQKAIAQDIVSKGLNPEQYVTRKDADGNLWQVNTQNGQQQLLLKSTAQTDKEDGGKVLHAGDVLYRNGKVEYANSGTATMDDATVDSLAKRVAAGDTTALVGLGRGAQGAENIAKIQKRVAEIVNDPEQAAALNGAAERTILENRAAQTGRQAYERRAGTTAAQMNQYGQTANLAIDTALEASKDVPRSTFVPLNKAMQMVQSNTGSPELARFVAATNTLVNEYSKAVGVGGTSSQSDRDHAREMLNTAQTPEQFTAVVGQLRREIEIAQRATASVPGHYGKPLGQEAPIMPGAGGQSVSVVPYLMGGPAGSAAAPAPLDVGQARQVAPGITIKRVD